MIQRSTILIIDDEPAAREAVEALLAAEPYQLHFAENGKSGIEIATELLPDLILLDVMMPGMDGFEVCRRLRMDSILGEIPIVMITALDDRGSRLLGIEAGADDFIAKPFDKTELRARVRAICRLNRYRLYLNERLRFQWLIDQSQDGYLILDGNNMILYANPSAQVYLNLIDEGKGVSFSETALNLYRAEPETAWQHWEKDHIVQCPLYLLRPESPSSPVFWLKMDELSLPKGDQVKRVVHLSDVTDLMRTESNMRRFQSAVTHKLVTPLSNMVLSLQLLQKQCEQDCTKKASELAAGALKAACRLNGDVQNILRYTRMPVLAMPGDRLSITRLPEMANDAAKSLQIQALSITIEPAMETKHLALTHAAMDSIVGELLDNAKKFHPEHAPIVEILVREKPGAEGLSQILVCDNGITLSPEQITWALTPFIQGEKYFTGESQGMGLGLPLVAKLVWQFNGRVRLFNRTDKPGVIVELLLPVVEDQAS